ncbi:hypothetical protein HRR83_008720 [Exophiala dermatitidis]|uniref:Steroid 5-alpha reductase C-terminal domain-containing protein n=2 Tax=Exophiala dermatitidis TaxID=5970 RepID=H6BXA2_EXODN|nr:uncharacterized protein HMPREF1120_04296 [Exophiala dermatitidis NIH/UT8656]KAJ4503908.1 hypothetical protein HRR75_007931 [Exophiala dermatitidis]EHY56204.1 hypothetical protein HMPREF1120_04296 [Exophiala dermatitidis NIH/UT8656]KAJ4505262.1 hypothetical protein HRR73_008535 [Exophiala dermatitidis]KAJ4505721.1 hypothetical protein HRR74_008632 [Exophiala dermatitidis]KAJ4536352.1 hypothetical protein HRR77_007273 [Exophiala dermatitidis]
MALPVVRSLTECADYNSTVAPYLTQLRPLPALFVESFANSAALKQLYLDTNPLVAAAALSLALAPIFLVVSEINKNYSQVDRVWSILPTVYNVHYALYAHLAGLSSTRLDIAAAISAIWSIRLTYNYYRKGGYSIGSEDYRWAIVKKYTGPAVFFVFNVTFISLAQSILLFTITTPTYVLLLAQRLATHSSQTASWGWEDSLAAITMLSCIGIAFVADEQQWRYQSAKAAYRKEAKVPAGFDRADLDRGFNTKGLFAYSRHPNFAAEQGVWVSLYLWSCLVTKTWYNWTGIGAAAYLILFQSSTWLTELLSSNKYPEYKIYQKQVAKFLPLPGSTPYTPTVGTPHGGAGSRLESDAIREKQRFDLR